MQLLVLLKSLENIAEIPIRPRPAIYLQYMTTGRLGLNKCCNITVMENLTIFIELHQLSIRTNISNVMHCFCSSTRSCVHQIVL